MGKPIQDGQKLQQGADSRFKKAIAALEAADDLMPNDPLAGTAADLRQVVKSIYVMAENVTELIAYRKMMGVD